MGKNKYNCGKLSAIQCMHVRMSVGVYGQYRNVSIYATHIIGF